MRLKKEFFVFPLLFLAAIWMTDVFWPDIRSHKLIPEGKTTMEKKVVKTEDEWKNILTPEQFRIMRKAGTEKPFSGKLNDHYQKGVYNCAGCGAPLFLSNTKYDHGTGWPSFSDPLDEKNIEYRKDFSLFMKRIEVRCATCGAHLGHVFDDGPPPSHRHFCINSVALDFHASPNDEEKKDIELPEKLQIATFAAGCFWGVEDKFVKIQGVVRTAVGYTGGTVEKPSYQQVCGGNTGHAEAVHIFYDPAIVSYADLLNAFFHLHDPTQLNRQGPDIGSQYRSVIFYHSEKQKQEAENTIIKLEKSDRFKSRIMTQIMPASAFYPAEEYHQKFYRKLSERKKG
jgi:peptide methionine sulfoxide reductase msrA/msrB